MIPRISRRALALGSAYAKLRTISAQVVTASRYCTLFVLLVINLGGFRTGVAVSDDGGSGPINVVVVILSIVDATRVSVSARLSPCRGWRLRSLVLTNAVNDVIVV